MSNPGNKVSGGSKQRSEEAIKRAWGAILADKC